VRSIEGGSRRTTTGVLRWREGSAAVASKHREDELFERSMEGVERLPDRERVLVPRRRTRKVTSPSKAEARTAAIGPDFELVRFGERVEGLRRGGDARSLTRLKTGEPPAGDRVDLHGLKRDEARRAVDALLERARSRQIRSVLIVHGRGRRSEGGPVLKEALFGWLTQPPWAGRVLAFVSAPPALGGAGATLVLLRRR
jgi:DNA-nicking Smr family endonuclease